MWFRESVLAWKWSCGVVCSCPWKFLVVILTTKVCSGLNENLLVNRTAYLSVQRWCPSLRSYAIICQAHTNPHGASPHCVPNISSCDNGDILRATSGLLWKHFVNHFIFRCGLPPSPFPPYFWVAFIETLRESSWGGWRVFIWVCLWPCLPSTTSLLKHWFSLGLCHQFGCCLHHQFGSFCFLRYQGSLSQPGRGSPDFRSCSNSNHALLFSLTSLCTDFFSSPTQEKTGFQLSNWSIWLWTNGIRMIDGGKKFQNLILLKKEKENTVVWLSWPNWAGNTQNG